eukprot:3940806-Pleurochrysis_carterae.AAC.1
MDTHAYTRTQERTRAATLTQAQARTRTSALAQPRTHTHPYAPAAERQCGKAPRARSHLPFLLFVWRRRFRLGFTRHRRFVGKR